VFCDDDDDDDNLSIVIRGNKGVGGVMKEVYHMYMYVWKVR